MPFIVKGEGRGTHHSVVANRDLLLSSSALRAPPPREDSIAKHPHLAGTPLQRETEIHSTPSSEAVHPSMKSALGGEGNFRAEAFALIESLRYT